jgi:hypothetical protein
VRMFVRLDARRKFLASCISRSRRSWTSLA